MLEAALKEVVNAAGLQVKELEAVALPALDALTKSVSTGAVATGKAGVKGQGRADRSRGF